MEEKYMVNDFLNDLKNFIKEYTDSILETQNIELRTTIQNLRNTLEASQYDMIKLSESKGYCFPIENAKSEEIEKIKNDLNIEKE